MPTGLVSYVVRAHKPAMAWLLPYRDLFTALAIGLLGGTTGMLGAQQPLLAAMVFPRLAMIIVPGAQVAAGFAATGLRAVQAGPAPAMPETRNPFALVPALGFAALVAALALAVRWAESRFGDTGIVTVLAITGSMDVDAAGGVSVDALGLLVIFDRHGGATGNPTGCRLLQVATEEKPNDEYFGRAFNRRCCNACRLVCLWCRQVGAKP